MSSSKVDSAAGQSLSRAPSSYTKRPEKLGGEPIFQLQPRHAREFTDVVGDEDHIPFKRLGSNERVEGTNRLTFSSQTSTKLTSAPSIRGCERHDLKRRSEETIEGALGSHMIASPINTILEFR